MKKSTGKKLLIALLAIALMAALAVFASAEGEKIGVCYISFEDFGVRIETDVKYPEPFGVIYNRSEVDLYEGDTILDVTRRFVEEVKGARANIIDIPGTSYMASIENVTTDSGKMIATLGEFDAGAWSGWVCKVNNQIPTVDPSEIIAEVDDEIEWLYTCQVGSDLGCDHSVTSAAITGLNFSAGELMPAFDESIKDYTLHLDDSIDSIRVKAELKSYETATVYTLVHDGASTVYKFNRDIPVADGDKIVISTKKTTDQYDEIYNFVGTVTDTDSVTITVSKGHTHTPGRVAIVNIIITDCEIGGSAEEVTYCDVCGEEISRQTVSIPAMQHVVETWTNHDIHADTAYREGVCEICGKTVREPIDPQPEEPSSRPAQDEPPQNHNFFQRVSAFFANFFESIRNFFARLFGR